VAFVRCSKRRGGTPTGERAALSARRAEARIVDYASVGVPPSFFLFCLALRAWIGMKEPETTAGFAPRSLESRRSVPFSCRVPHASDAGRIARTMVLALEWRIHAPPGRDSPLASEKVSMVQNG
jgi:hypothetical protein